MFGEKFSRPKKIALRSLLVLLMMIFSSQPIFAPPYFGFYLGVAEGVADYIKQGLTTYAFFKINPGCFKIGPALWMEVNLEGGYNRFKLDLEEVEGIDDNFHWWNINPTVQFSYRKSKFMPFFNIGPGVYIPKEGDVRLGGKLGLGFDYRLSKMFMFEIGANYHHIFLKEGDFSVGENTFNFICFHAGIVIDF